MDLAEQIVAALRARNRDGETYEQMEKASGVSGSYIHQLANRQSSPLNMSLKKLLALFPRAEIRLESAAADASPSDMDRARLESERSELEFRRRELDLERQVFELEKRIAELEQRPARSPLTMDGGAAAPYRASSLSSQSTK